VYQSDNPPRNYQDYKRRITIMDEMRRCQEMYKGTTCAPVIWAHDTNMMEVDHSEKKDDRKCFMCSKGGHLARACPKKERRQGF
jgi:hypothetical protein